jgi:hypothetical protein
VVFASDPEQSVKGGTFQGAFAKSFSIAESGYLGMQLGQRRWLSESGHMQRPRGLDKSLLSEDLSFSL